MKNFFQPRLPVWAQAALLFAIFFAFMASIQFSTPDMPDNDGFYHIKMASLMREQGLKPAFPYMPLTILNGKEFYDHHFLFHVALIPFTFGDLRLGAKWSAVTFAALAFLAVWWLLRGQKVRYAGFWAIGLLAVSQAFLYRMSITRPLSLSLGVLALGLHWMFTGKNRHLAVLAFLYVWMYDAFPLLTALAVLYTAALWLTEGRLNLRPLAFVAAGTVLGLIVNIYFPQDLIFIYRHLLPKLTNATSISVGNEWYPYDTGQLLQNSPLALIILLGGILALGLRGRRMNAPLMTAFLATALFGLMLFQARRFIEYFPAFALVFASMAWSPLLESSQDKDLEPLPKKVSVLFKNGVPIILFIMLLVGAYVTRRDAVDSIQASKTYTLYAEATKWLMANTAPGERIFQTDWDDFPRLFYYDTYNTYLVGLDPTYMQLYNPDLYDLWVSITDGNVHNLSKVIPSEFGAYYVLSDLQHKGFISAASADPGMRQVYRDQQAVIFEIVK
ncbi:MAG: hypothetical protein HYR70_13765 [Chloroflexi bacterium]|nr:hypothetical protein [Chloroflexota bacterium]MBI3339698.1 hypothetical protein [Chloroflexota bacterium]